MSRFLLFSLLALAIPFSAVAGEKDSKQIKAGLVSVFPELSTATIKLGPTAGLFEIEHDAQVFYATPDGKFIFMGDIVDLNSRINLTENRRAAIRVRLIESVGEKNMIVMGPEKPLRTITVFTDVDCPYCAKLHLDVPYLNNEGVKVRYLFFPRMGLNSETYRRTVSVWCAKDRVKAVGIAKAGGKLERKTCSNPVKEHFLLGQRLGIDGTPTTYLDDGRKLPGYVPPAQLLGILDIKPGPKSAAAR